MSSIKFNTKVIKEKITNLNTENKYYSSKKDSFNSSNFSSAGKLTTYLASIQSVYSDIANNIKAISDYLKDYADDAEGLENLMSGLGGSIKDAEVSGVVKNYKNTIDNYMIDDRNLFEIRAFNKSASGFAGIATEVASREANSNSSNLGKTNNSTNEATNSSGVSTNGASMVSNDSGLFGGGLSRVGLNSVYDFNSGTYGLPQVEGMHYDFLTGAMVPDNSIDETTLTALLEIREMIDALITLGATEEEIDEFLACESVEESNQKLLELQMKYDPEVRAQIYEYSYVNSLNETFAEYGDSFSSLAEIDAKIAELNEQIASASEARNFTRIGEEGLLSAIELSKIDDINDDTVVLYAYQDPNDPSKFYYTAYDPNVFMSVPLFETTLENTSELSYTMESPKSYTLKEVLDLCDSETAAKFRDAFLNDGSKDMKKSLQKEIESSIENPDVSAVEELIAQRDLYQYLSDYVKEELDYIEGSIDPYKYNSDFAENSQVSESALKDIENYTNTFEYLIDGFAGERSIIMPEMTDENTATLLYAVFNKTGDITYKNGYFYDKNGVNIPDASFNLLLNDFSKWEGELTSEEKGIYNYVYNTEGPLAAYEWLQGIASKIDNRYVNSKSEKAQAYAEAHPRLATLLSFNPLEKLSNSMKILYASATDQKIRNSYTVDNASIYRSTVGEIIGDKYGDGWQTVYNIGTSAVSESAWSIMHVVSGGATLYLKTAMSFFEGLPEQVGNALKRGYTDDQAVFSGLLCCGAEAATEYVSAAKLLGIEDFDNYIFSPFIHVKFGATAASLYNVFVGQPAFEIMEELTSDGAERIIDSVLSNAWNHDSERDINYKKYLELYGNSEDAKRQLVKDYFNDIGNIALQTYFSTLVSSGVYMGAGRVKSGGSTNSSSNQFAGDYQAALTIVNATSGNIDGNIDADISSRAVDTMLKIKSGELSLGDIVKGKINTSPATNVENQTARVKEQPVKPLGQAAANISQNTTANTDSKVKVDDVKTLVKQIKEASEKFGYTAIEIPGTEVLNNNIVSNIKDSSHNYFTFQNDAGETFGVFVPDTSETLEQINKESQKPFQTENPWEANSYQLDSEHILYYDMVTGKTYSYEDMSNLMQGYNAKAKSMFYEALDQIKANTKNPVILEAIDNFNNISGLTASWDIVYNALRGSFASQINNVVYLDLDTFNNYKRVETILHEVSHSVHNAANNAQVPSNYLEFLFKAINHLKNNRQPISKFGNKSSKYRSRFRQLAAAKFDSDFDSDLRAQVFSEENRNKVVSTLGENVSLTSEEIDALLQQEYEQIKENMIYNIYDDYMRDREYAYTILNGIMGDTLGIACRNPLNYVDENGNIIELSPSVIYGHDIDYNKRTNFLSSSFHELMAEFGSGILLDEYNNSTEFSDGFIEIFGQEFYDFIKGFYLDSLACVSKGETHEFDALSENDMKVLSMYLKSFNGLMNVGAMPNISDINKVILNKNNVELDENGEYNFAKLFSKASEFSKKINVPVVIDASNMTNEQFVNLTNELVKAIGSWNDINIDNVGLLMPDGLVHSISYIVLHKDNTDLTASYSIKQKLKSVSPNHEIYIDITGMNDTDIRKLIMGITSFGAEGINFNNVKLLNNGSLSDISLSLNKDYMLNESGKINYSINGDLKNISQHIPVNLDFSNMDFESIKSIFNNINTYINKGSINFNNVAVTIMINGVTYNIDYDTLGTYVETQTIPQVSNADSSTNMESLTREEFINKPDYEISPSEDATAQVISISSLINMLSNPQDIVNTLADPAFAVYYSKAFKQLKDAIAKNSYDILSVEEKANLDLACQVLSEQDIKELSNLTLSSEDGREIKVDNLLEILSDANKFSSFFETADANQLADFIMLKKALKNSNYQLNEILQARLKAISDKAYNSLDITKLENNEDLPESIRSILFLYNYRSKINVYNVNCLLDYYFESLLPRLKENANLVYEEEYLTFKKWAQNINSFTRKLDMDVPDNFYEKLDRFNREFAKNERDLYAESIKKDINRISELLSEKTIYNIETDIPLLEKYFACLASEINLDSTTLYSRGTAQSYLSLIEIIQKFGGYFKKDTVAKVFDIFNNNVTIDNNSLNMPKALFEIFLKVADLNDRKNVEFILNYLKNNQNVNIDPSILMQIKLPPLSLLTRNLKNIINRLKVSFLDRAFDSDLFFQYGQNQNATAPNIDITMNSSNWLIDEQDFKNYLISKRKFSADEANNLLENIKQNRLYNEDITYCLEYIYEYCDNNGRTDAVNIIASNFTVKYNEFYKKFSNKLKALGMSEIEVVRTLCALDSTGVCTYAATINAILSGYIGRVEQFEQDFGYQMPVVNGKKILDGTELLLDTYIFLNSNKNPNAKNNMFYYDANGELHVKNLRTNNQVYLLRYNDDRVGLINSFLATINPKLKFQTLYYGKKEDKDLGKVKQYDIQKFKSMIFQYLSDPQNRIILNIWTNKTTQNGKEVILPQRLYNENLINFQEIDLGKGHAVFVTGITDDYLIVSSWGKKYFININDLLVGMYDIMIRKATN